jgi:hypothetical protein
MGGALGGVQPVWSTNMQLGRAVYEKISNFLINHQDIDEAGIKQLYSIARYLDVPIDNYNLRYPPAIEKLINLGSIKHSRLWGEIVKCNLNITNKRVCPRCGYVHSNLGKKIEDTLTYKVTAGQPIIVHNKETIGTYAWTLVTVPSGVENNGEIYLPFDLNEENISSICEPSLNDLNLINSYNISLLVKYNICEDGVDFYEYVDGYPFLDDCDNLDKHPQAIGHINWNDEWTSLNRNTSSLNDWFDNDGILNTLFEYTLLKGLEIKPQCVTSVDITTTPEPELTPIVSSVYVDIPTKTPEVYAPNYYYIFEEIECITSISSIKVDIPTKAPETYVPPFNYYYEPITCIENISSIKVDIPTKAPEVYRTPFNYYQYEPITCIENISSIKVDIPTKAPEVYVPPTPFNYYEPITCIENISSIKFLQLF